MQTTLVSWNVNSVRARLNALNSLVNTHKPSVVCLQETKVVDSHFPEIKCAASIKNGQKSYNGVATLLYNTAKSPHKIQRDPFDRDSGSRVVSTSFRNLRIINVYIPNGGSSADAYGKKLLWLVKLFKYVEKQQSLYKNCILVGDFNICPSDNDVFDADVMRNAVTCTEAERDFTRALKTQLNMYDAFSDYGNPDYTWWDYRNGAYPRNNGLRIDHFFVSESLRPFIYECMVLRDYRSADRPSDHAPILLRLRK